MKNLNSKSTFLINTIVVIFILLTSCEKYAKDLTETKVPTRGDVFIDGFTPGLNYAAFAGTNPTAFQVVSDITYQNSEKAMRIDVPSKGDPSGAYAGGTYFLSSGRNLSSYNVLTFWAKTNNADTIAELGFANDFGENIYQTALSKVPTTTYWKKYYIPIPDPSKLTNEKGMFYFAAAHNSNGQGYSIWIDDVKFEKIESITLTSSQILNGANLEKTSFKGVELFIDNLKSSFLLPDGTAITINTPASYFNFESSNPSVATASKGKVLGLSAGYSVITAKLQDVQSKGSLVVNISGFSNAPTPTVPSSNVVSLFSDNYTNSKVDYYNGYWEPYQKTTSADFVVGKDNVLNYLNFNFFGISFSSPTIDASTLNFLSMDIYVPSALNPDIALKITIRDFGNDGKDGGGDDTDVIKTFTSSDLASNQWKTLKIPLTMSSKSKLGLIIFSDSDKGNFKNFYLDNIYFHK